MSLGKFLTGFAIGGAVGAIAGILLAPKSGKETREDLVNASKEIYSKAEGTVKDIQTKADDVISELQQKGENIISNVQNFIEKQKEGHEA